MASITVKDLTINGVTMPSPALQGVTISTEKIWSKDTGRTSSGKMVGTIVAIKATVSIKWAALTPNEVATIEAAVSDADNPFVPMEYVDMCGNYVRKMVYFGTPTYTSYSWASGLQYVSSVEVSGIEQ